jgi:hypothetical protein
MYATRREGQLFWCTPRMLRRLNSPFVILLLHQMIKDGHVDLVSVDDLRSIGPIEAAGHDLSVHRFALRFGNGGKRSSSSPPGNSGWDQIMSSPMCCAIRSKSESQWMSCRPCSAQKVPMSTSIVFLTVTPFDLRSR